MGTDCSTWVPPYLQGSCSGGCGAITPQTPSAGEPFGIETGFPSPNDPSWAHTPYSFAIKSEYVGNRIQDYLFNVLPLASSYPAWDGGLPNYPYIGNPPALPPDDGNDTNRPYSWGAYDSVFPNNGVCTVTLAESKMTYPAIPAHAVSGSSATCNVDTDCMEGGTAPCIGADPDAGTMGLCSDSDFQAQTTLSYKWSNVKVAVDSSTGNIGGQIFADLTITQDSCAQSFHASIMFPRVTCNGAQNDAGYVTSGDQSQCTPPAANGDNYPVIGDASSMGQIYGSGLYPSVPVACKALVPPAPDGGAPPQQEYDCMPTRTAPAF
jgi:hypothetical protein